MKSIRHPSWLAALALLGGAAIYAWVRPGWPALAGSAWVGLAPSLLHSFAFTVWTARTLDVGTVGAGRVALAGALLAGSIEAFQHPALHVLLPEALAVHWGGTFDPLDLVAAVAGSAVGGWLATLAPGHPSTPSQDPA